MAAPRDFPDQETLLSEIAEEVAGRLSAAVEERGSASLVVSGGRTPEALFQRLSRAQIPWSKVTVTLADERWVPEGDPESNAALVKRALLQGRAAEARFLPLYGGEETPEAGQAACEQRLGSIERPFDLVLLGMGEDGHTASLFPGAANLQYALDPEGKALCLPIRAPGAAQPRMTLTLSALLNSRSRLLLITGEGKRQALASASAEGPVEEMPVRAFLDPTGAGLEVLWAP